MSVFFGYISTKSAGMATRALLRPYYKEVDRVNKPKNFIQSHPSEYNDILNNYKVVLGEYQFKRCLFARDYLYKDQWDSMFSFAFVREPTDRCLSMFSYLYQKDLGFLMNLKRSTERVIKTRKLRFTTTFAFDAFLDHIQEARDNPSIYEPIGLHFTTHTATVWDDITDLDGNILLKKVFRLEDLIPGINYAFGQCSIEKRLQNKNNMKFLNENLRRKHYQPTKAQLKRVEDIYYKDFELYERARTQSFLEHANA